MQASRILLSLALAVQTPVSGAENNSELQPVVYAEEASDIYPLDIFSNEIRITSIIYSSVRGEALVGVINNHNRAIGSVLECQAPHGPLASSIMVSDLTNCRARRSAWFEVSERNTNKFKERLEENLKTNFKIEFQRQKQNGEVNMIMSILAAGFTAGTIAGGVKAMQLLKARRWISGGFAAATVIAVGTVTALWDYATARHIYYVLFEEAPSLEGQVIANYQNLLANNPETPKIDFKNQPWALTWEVLKNSIFQSIREVNY